MASFSTLIAGRYLKPKRSFVSIITLLSVLGVALGVASLIVVIAVMSGFEKRIKEDLIGFEPHLVFMNDMMLPAEERSSWRDLQAELKKLPFIQTVTPYVETEVLIKPNAGEFSPPPDVVGMNHEGGFIPARLTAIDPDDTAQIEKLQKLIKKIPGNDTPENQGTFDLSGDSLVLNDDLAEKLGVGVGDRIDVMSATAAQKALQRVEKWNELPQEEQDQQMRTIMDEIKESVMPTTLEVTGIISSLQHPMVLFAPLHVGRELAALKDDVHGLHLITNDAYRAETFENEIWSQLPREALYGWGSVPWTKKWARWFATIKNERMMMYLVLFMILLVAAFSITNTLITVTVQKRREIGIMNALGASVGQVSALFLIQGFIVGLIGTSVGYGLGWLVLHFRNTLKDWLARAFGVELFPKEMYFLAEIPANLRWEDVVIICLGALIICMIAALPPAWMAARLDPAKALRSE